MSIKVNGPVEWDGNTLAGWIIINGKAQKFTADRDTIHKYAPGFSDALSWEMDRHRSEIFEKLVPYLTGKRS